MVDFGVSIRSFKIYPPKLGEKIRGIFVKDLHEPFFFFNPLLLYLLNILSITI